MQNATCLCALTFDRVGNTASGTFRQVVGGGACESCALPRLWQHMPRCLDPNVRWRRCHSSRRCSRQRHSRRPCAGSCWRRPSGRPAVCRQLLAAAIGSAVCPPWLPTSPSTPRGRGPCMPRWQSACVRSGAPQLAAAMECNHYGFGGTRCEAVSGPSAAVLLSTARSHLRNGFNLLQTEGRRGVLAGRRVPGRRRGAPLPARRRFWHEHRHPRCAQPGLEACRRAAGWGLPLLHLCRRLLPTATCGCCFCTPRALQPPAAS